MRKLSFFGIVFFPIPVGITVGLTIYGLSDIDSSDLSAIGLLVWKSTVKAMIVGASLGLLNLIFRLEPYDKIR